MGEAYDPLELRRRIVVCFSGPELKQLAESLGIGSIPWDRGNAEAVREIIRQAEQYSGPELFLAKLREMHPLVEWPDPPAPKGADAPAPSAPEAAPAASGGLQIVAHAPLGALPGSPPVEAAQPEIAPPAAAKPASPAAELPTFRDPHAPRAGVWPGTTDPKQAAPSRGVDPRVLLLVAGLTVIAAVIAYLAGRSSNAPQAEAPEGVATSAPRRAEGPATRASDALSRSLSHVARACELQGKGPFGPDIFRRVTERCGPVPVQRPRPTSTLEPPPSRDPSAPRDSDSPARDPGARDPAADPPRAKRPGRDGSDPPAPAQAKGCLGKCDSDHRACKNNCGAEPTEASAYDGYQKCLGQCLSGASRCKMACP